jgi:hypothetical protein
VKPLIRALGADYEQWKALVMVSLRLDFRATSFGREYNRREPSPGWRVFRQVLLYVLLGGATTLVAAQLSDPFLTGTFVNTYVIFMVGTAMLVDHNSAVISPTDYAILGFRPITSRTYFVSRLTNVLVYTLAMTAAISLIPATVFFQQYGFSTGLVATLALFVCSLTVALAVIVGYASLLRRVGARRLRNLLSYLQLAIGLVMYGGYFLFADLISNVPDTFHISTDRWLLLDPAAWFASYAEIAAGRASSLQMLAALLSVMLFGFLLSRLRGRLSLEYSERLGALLVDAPAQKPATLTRATTTGLSFLRAETRAVAMLVRSHFRNDIKFRMGVLGVLPMTIIYLIMGLRDQGGGQASFTPSTGRLWLVTVPALLFPLLLKSNLARSDTFHASWIFFSTPVDRARLIAASRDVLVAFFLVPYLILLGIAISLFGVDPGYLLVYLTITGLLSHVTLIGVMYINPELPFAKPVDRSGSSGRVFLLMLLIGAFSLIIPFLSRLVYGDALKSMVVFGVIVAFTSLLNRMLRARILKRAVHLEFQG